jgi:E3 ubiquitin-protein ligase SHPRH
MNQWWQTHRSCPLCKKKLKSSEFRNISFKPGEVEVHEETNGAANTSRDSASGPSNTSIYSNLSNSMMKEIKMINLDGSYGSKIDMIARHLLWIRTNDPGAKSIIFSQYGDFLQVLRAAFSKWRIGVSGIHDKDGIQKFKEDPSIECFLLDAKSDSSGLNLVNATNVFLCEPLINPAIELQAIARVHRIGQQRPTTVFMYLISDTVEQAIYDISVARRLEHMKTARPRNSSPDPTSLVDEESTLDAANSAEMEAAQLKNLLTKKGDGEVVQSNDLWACLFGSTRKPLNSPDHPNSAISKYIRAEAAQERIASGM